MYDSPVSHPGDRESGTANVWKDTSEETYGSYLDNSHHLDTQQQLRPTVAMLAAGGTHGHPDITVGLLEDEDHVSAGAAGRQKEKEYTGRRVVWPGALMLLLITVGAFTAITYFAVKEYNAAQKQQALTVSETVVNKTKKSTAIKICELPNYVTDAGKLYATGGDANTKHEVHFTGINWSGMENSEGVPHGLATGQTDLDTLAQKLVAMDINSVRLPLNAKMIIEDSEPDTTLYVSSLNSDLNVASYIDMIKVVVQGLAKEQIAVLLDIHKIDPEFTDDTSEHLWYTDDYPLSSMLKMYQTLASELCNDLYYNIIGIDLKNEPVGGCWPADDSDEYCDADVNWPRAVEKIGNTILKICPNWLIVVEGNYATNQVMEVSGENVTYNDWYGASLQNATKNPITLDTANKIVFAPHFYSPSVYPSSYFFASQKVDSDGGITVTEFPNTTAGNKELESALTAVLDAAFGDILTAGEIPVFYGEFGGIFGSAEDLEGKTSTRVIELLIQYADEKGMTGGFSWALNPDGEYAFNDAYKPDDPWKFGLYADSSWDDYNEDYAVGLQKLKGNGIIPCFSTTVSTSSTSTSSGSSDTTATVTASSSSAATATTSSSSSAAATTATTTTSSSAATDTTASSAATTATAT